MRADFEDAREIRRDLQSIRLFSDALRPDQMDELAAACSRVTFPAGTAILKQGEYGAVMFCIIEGEVSVTYVDGLNKENEISRLRAGTVVGEIEMLTGEPRVATVRALTDVRALQIPKSALDTLFAKSPDLIENVGATLAIRQSMLDQIAPDQSRSLRGRLVAKMRSVFPGRLRRSNW
jgi:CRP-like cAMP-binding protein